MGYSCMDHYLVLYYLASKYAKRQNHLYIAFLEVKGPFDSVGQLELWKKPAVTSWILYYQCRTKGRASRATTPGTKAKRYQQALPSRDGAWNGATSSLFGVGIGIGESSFHHWVHSQASIGSHVPRVPNFMPMALYTIQIQHLKYIVGLVVPCAVVYQLRAITIISAFSATS